VIAIEQTRSAAAVLIHPIAAGRQLTVGAWRAVAGMPTTCCGAAALSRCGRGTGVAF
jgi:hypothetical protein